jgi:hypothetical protein
MFKDLIKKDSLSIDFQHWTRWVSMPRYLAGCGKRFCFPVIGVAISAAGLLLEIAMR